MKSISFTTQMVRALLEGRKTAERRPIKLHPENLTALLCKEGQEFSCFRDDLLPPFLPGDILYVRESWSRPSRAEIAAGVAPDIYLYRADRVHADTWRSPHHMPKEAARLFLRVNEVRIEHLHDIFLLTPKCKSQVQREGYRHSYDFIVAWDKGLTKADRAAFEFESNPWVWVIEFDLVPKSEALMSS